ncbi:MAG: alpha-hydroxy-acid oxidizing protein [Acidobacteriales bacterium]|nr:alpha-hydroxy-acid oxidizing protein [Terriglobales bacterium]
MTINRRRVLIQGAAAAGFALLPGFEAAASQKPAVAKADLERAVSLSDYEAIARRRIERVAWEYISGAAADEITLRWNREALDHLMLDPRVLRDVSRVDTRTKVLGLELPYPVFLAPTALHKLAHPEGELATVTGAGKARAPMVLSTMSSTKLEDIAAKGKTPLWFQLYVQKDKGFTEQLVHRAEAAGYRALVVTVDTPVEGIRNRQDRAHFHLPPGVALENLRDLPTGGKWSPGTEKEVFANILPDRLTWKDIEWLQSLTKLPVLLKGVLNAEDADMAVRAGVAGILVSNHGARNLDTVPPTITALPRITDKVAGRIAVLMDGGVRRGTDVLKALALGANAVLIGRPVFWGLAADGAEGVANILNILRHEFEVAMVLTGRRTVAEIDRSVIWR